MIKTDRYVQTEAAGMLYRLIPVTEEIIRCVIGKEEIKGNDSLIIEKKEYPAVEFAAEENEAGTKDWKSSGLSGTFIWKNRVEACGRNQVVHTG